MWNRFGWLICRLAFMLGKVGGQGVAEEPLPSMSFQRWLRNYTSRVPCSGHAGSLHLLTRADITYLGLLQAQHGVSRPHWISPSPPALPGHVLRSLSSPLDLGMASTAHLLGLLQEGRERAGRFAAFRIWSRQLAPLPTPSVMLV